MMPRMTSGYIFNETARGDIVSGILGPGLWSHFIHPDDIFDQHRSEGKDWAGLKADFENMITFVKKNYPWLKPVNATDGYRAMRKYDEIGVDFSREGNTVKIRVQEPGIYFRLRFNGKRILSVKGGTVVYSYRNTDAAVIQAEGSEIIAVFGRKE